jgi:hypothetical protein
MLFIAMIAAAARAALACASSISPEKRAAMASLSGL